MPATTSQLPSIKGIPASSWEKLSQKKIFFGHQSVGFNIIDGIKDIMKEYPQIRLNIIETADPADINSGIFAHSRVGKNMDPKSKINDFVGLMNKGLGNKVDYAALKFCYIDINPDTDVGILFNEYHAAMTSLKEKYTDVTIVHFTSPLTTIQTGPKAWIKKIIGRTISGIDDNIKRNEYNELLLKKYEGEEPVFDLAKIESTLPNGTRSSFVKNGKTYYSLAPQYTNDGGHLNEPGRKIVAEQFLVFLANL